MANQYLVPGGGIDIVPAGWTPVGSGSLSTALDETQALWEGRGGLLFNLAITERTTVPELLSRGGWTIESLDILDALGDLEQATEPSK